MGLPIELMIVWDRIAGLQTVSSVGQIMPFALDVGGLCRVFSGKLLDGLSKRYGKTSDLHKVKMALENYMYSWLKENRRN